MPLQPPVVPDFRAGVYEHGVDLNTSLRDALGFLTARCVFKARQTTTQSIPSGAWTAITFVLAGIDEDLVLSADMPRNDFLVSVYLGKDVGFYSDEYFADENSAGEDFGADDEL